MAPGEAHGGNDFFSGFHTIYLIITAAIPNANENTIRITGITHDSIIFRDITDFIPAIKARYIQRINSKKLIWILSYLVYY